MRRLVGRTDAVIAVPPVLTVLESFPGIPRLGHALQAVLPLVALCRAATRPETVERPGRRAGLPVGITGPWSGIGDSPVRRRADGGGKAFPPGHAAAARPCAVPMIRHRAALHPVVRAAAVGAAAFTGGSRIDPGRRRRWQVMASAVWGRAIACLPLAGLKGAGRWMRRLRGGHA
jgi:hypothetical protein